MWFRHLLRSAQAADSPALAEKAQDLAGPAMPAQFSLLPKVTLEAAVRELWSHPNPAPRSEYRGAAAKVHWPCRLPAETNPASAVLAQAQASAMARVPAAA